jgi:hypothetical protein
VSASVSPYGDAADAIDYALGHIDDAFERSDFLECWRDGDVSDWPAYFRWLHTQRAGAAEARGEQ